MDLATLLQVCVGEIGERKEMEEMGEWEWGFRGLAAGMREDRGRGGGI